MSLIISAEHPERQRYLTVAKREDVLRERYPGSSNMHRAHYTGCGKGRPRAISPKVRAQEIFLREIADQE